MTDAQILAGVLFVLGLPAAFAIGWLIPSIAADRRAADCKLDELRARRRTGAQE